MTEAGETLKFSEVVHALGMMNGIMLPERDTLAARVEQIHKALPGFGGTGRGKKRQYGVDDVLALAIVIDLLDVGLTPAGIAAVLKHNAFADKALSFKLDLREAITKEVPIVVTAGALGHLRRGRTGAKLTVGQPDPTDAGPYVLAFPAARMKQVKAAVSFVAQFRKAEEVA